MKWSLVNVVMYDGCDAYVCKFVLPTKDYEVTEQGRKDVIEYLNGNGEILKIDVLYGVTLENIMAFRLDEDKFCIWDRFNKMYF